MLDKPSSKPLIADFEKDALLRRGIGRRQYPFLFRNLENEEFQDRPDFRRIFRRERLHSAEPALHLSGPNVIKLITSIIYECL